LSVRAAARRSAIFSARSALLLGFGSILLLLVISGVDAIQVLGEMQRGNARIRSDYLERARKLDEIRSALYLSGTYIRDYLLEPDSENARRHQSSLKSTKARIEGELAGYETLLRPEQRAPFAGLQRELAAYWRSLDPVLHWTSEQRREGGYAFLRDEVFPRRTNMLAIAGRIAEVNEEEFTAGDRRLSEAFTTLRQRLVAVLAVTVLLGLLLAGATIHQIMGLERATARHLAEVTRAREELRELSARLVSAQENERATISRELHDAVGQSLSAVLLEVRNLAAVMPGSPPALGAHLDTIRKLAEGAVGMVRNMALLLRPSMLDDLGLIPALEWQARDVSRRTGMLVHVAAVGVPDDLPEEHKTCIYRIVQEALNNISKHAGAKTVRITVERRDGEINLAIQDDGRGFTPGPRRGLGLIGIGERVENLRGSFRVESEPGHGSLLAVTLPLAEAALA
jgi:signal transduction histidine kinase